MVLKTFKNLPKPHRTGLVIASFLLGGLILLPSEPVEASRHQESLVLDAGVRYPLDIAVADTPEVYVAEDEGRWETYKVGRGDTLAKIFKRAGFSPRDTYEVTQAGELAKTLVTLIPGDELSLRANEDGSFNGLRYRVSVNETLLIQRDKENDKLVADIEAKDIETRYNFAQGEIDSSFWNAGVEAGLTDNQIMHLAGIFGWDIDFAMGIRKGDMFNIVYEEKYIDGEFVGFGDIVAAEFVNQGDRFVAIAPADRPGAAKPVVPKPQW